MAITVVAEYLFDEGSGTTIADSVGSADLTGSGGSWVTSSGDGYELDFLTDSALVTYASSSLDGALDGETDCGFVFVIRGLNAGSGEAPTVGWFRTSSGRELVLRRVDDNYRLYYQDSLVATFPHGIADGNPHVILGQFKTNEATQANRFEAWVDGTRITLSSSGGLPAQGAPISLSSTDTFGVKDNEAVTTGAVFYLAAFTGSATQTEIEDLSDALLADNDTSPFAGGGFSDIAANLAGGGSVAGDIDAYGAIATSASGSGSCTGAGTAYGVCAASLTGGGVVAGSATAYGVLAAGATGSGACSGDIDGWGEVAASCAGSATATGAISGRVAIDASCAGGGAVSADIDAYGELASSLSGSGACTGTLSDASSQSASLAGSGTCVATIHAWGDMAANLGGGAALSGQISGRVDCSAGLSGGATCAAAGTAFGLLVAALAATATSTPTIHGWGALAATLAGMATCSATAEQGCFASLVGSATCTGTLTTSTGPPVPVTDLAAQVLPLHTNLSAEVLPRYTELATRVLA